jgi:precorrin-2 dehydrogenase/sirohydrochlorin ferrochelatase
VIPLLHDLAGERVLVFGGGTVGARRARTFAAEPGVWTVVLSPAFADAPFGGARRVRAAPAPDDVPGWLDRVEPAVAVAATDDPAVNDAVERAARQRGVLYNRADRAGDRAPGNVAVPSILRDGEVTVAVSTGVPALTRALRERVEPVLEGAGAMAALAGGLRDRLRERYSAAERRAALRAVVRSDQVQNALARGDDTAEQVAERVARDAAEAASDRAGEDS